MDGCSTTESGLSACYGKSPGNRAFSTSETLLDAHGAHVCQVRATPPPELDRVHWMAGARVGVTGAELGGRGCCGGRVQVELAVHIERECAVGVDVRPEQRRERATVGAGEAVGRGWLAEDGRDRLHGMQLASQYLKTIPLGRT
jgi:hypothetical protein